MTGGSGVDLFVFGALTDTGSQPDVLTDLLSGVDAVSFGGLGL